MLWRHRFITDTWGWEVPAGRVDAGEAPMAAGHREALEETGWAPGPLTPLTSYHPHNGSSDATFHLFLATEATHVGPPTDTDESFVGKRINLETGEEDEAGERPGPDNLLASVMQAFDGDPSALWGEAMPLSAWRA